MRKLLRFVAVFGLFALVTAACAKSSEEGVSPTGGALPGAGMSALDQAPEFLLGGFAVEAEAGGAVAVPAAWGLAVAGQVLLAVVGEPFEVVVLTAGRQLGHVQHHPRPSSRAPLRQRTHPWCIALLGKKMRS